jgi:CRISPR-associated endonuclease/helicase Cas3
MNDTDELAQHLVASHHGYGRPDFPEQAHDRSCSLEQNTQAIADQQDRFEILQQKYGWWGLAYLETLIKAADAAASRGEQ